MGHCTLEGVMRHLILQPSVGLVWRVVGEVANVRGVQASESVDLVGEPRVLVAGFQELPPDRVALLVELCQCLAVFVPELSHFLS